MALRAFRLKLEITGRERPTRHDGAVDYPQTALLNGEVVLEVDGLPAFHVRLRDADGEEWEQTMDEFEQTVRRLRLDVGGLGFAGDDEEDESDGA